MKVERCQRNFILLQSFIPPADSWELRAERSTIVARNLSTAFVYRRRLNVTRFWALRSSATFLGHNPKP